MTRAQVSTASSALCRDGQLDRIRSGVYQWSASQRAPPGQISAARRAPPPAGSLAPESAAASARQPGRMPTAELFSQLFPDGIQMTGELLADLEQWTRRARSRHRGAVQTSDLGAGGCRRRAGLCVPRCVLNARRT